MKQTILALTLSLSVALAGCVAPAAEGSPSPAPTQPAVSAPVDLTAVDTSLSMSEYTTGLKPDGVAMTVNGTPVLNSRYLYWLAYHCDYIQSIYQTYYGTAPDWNEAGLVDIIREEAQGVASSAQVLMELYRQHNITMTEAQQQELDALLESYPQEELDKMLSSYGLTKEEYREIYSDNFLYTNLIAQVVPAPTEEQLRDYIKAHEVFGVKHILLKTVSADQTDEAGNVTQSKEAYNAQRRQLAEQLLAQLGQADDREELFDRLMEEHSEDGRGPDGKLLSPEGYVFSEADSLVGGFREATLELEEGELSGLVETDYGYHILLRLPVEPASVESQCRDELVNQFLAAHMEEAEVEVSDHIESLDIAAFYRAFQTYQAAVHQ